MLATSVTQTHASQQEKVQFTSSSTHGARNLPKIREKEGLEKAVLSMCGKDKKFYYDGDVLNTILQDTQGILGFALDVSKIIYNEKYWKTSSKDKLTNWKDMWITPRNWNESGRKKFVKHYKNGIENGVFKEWDEDGTLTYEGNYVDGVEDIR
jgi:antitoxin component YwqK of YwqJK toxin-antitoxin module